MLQLVRDHDGAIDAAELAERMRLHVTTARFHLDALCDEGVITRTRLKRAGVGRPRTGYVAIRNRLDYRSLAEVLALELGDTVAERRERAERAGQRWAGRILAGESADCAVQPDDVVDSDDLHDRAAAIAGIFGRMGFDAELAPAAECGDVCNERTIRLYGCPVRDMSHSHPEVSCAVHRGLLQGLASAGAEPDGGAAFRGELKPFAEPELCIARVVSSAERAASPVDGVCAPQM